MSCARTTVFPSLYRFGVAQQTPGHSVLCFAKKNQKRVTYGRDWYETTRELGAPKTVKEQLERYKKANLEANKGLERKDLYSDQWAGDQYRGSSFNILTFIGALFILTPIAGLIFAYFSYGVLWG